MRKYLYKTGQLVRAVDADDTVEIIGRIVSCSCGSGCCWYRVDSYGDLWNVREDEIKEVLDAAAMRELRRREMKNRGL
ncbi:MAG: hypothetical protein J6V24_03840 [Clostridia bacterium]|nr:hypothetical protein [Clostridia bacterium]